MQSNLRISLWSGPRNISTALMYSFAQRADTRVFDEPLYGHYLRVTNADEYHPGAAETKATYDQNGERVIRDVMFGDYAESVLFFKNMTHFLVDLDWGFMDGLCNVLLTRDPRDMLPSYAKQIHQPSMRDVGYEDHIKLLTWLRARGQNPAILDSAEILKNPEGVLRKLCEHIGIAFDPAVLSWEAGKRPEDGPWGQYWYHNVWKSTGFAPYKPKTEPFPEHLKPLLDKCLPFYEQLSAQAIKA